MSASGQYTLQLICDGPSTAHPEQLVQFTAPTRMEAKAKARDYGWLLATHGKAFCPECSEERRKTRHHA